MAVTKAQLRKEAMKTIKAMQVMKTEKPMHEGLLWIAFLLNPSHPVLLSRVYPLFLACAPCRSDPEVPGRDDQENVRLRV